MTKRVKQPAMPAKNSDFLTLPLLYVAPNLAKDTETLRKPFLYLFQKWNGKSWTMRESIVRAQSHDRAVDYRWLVNVLYVMKCEILLFPISIFQISIPNTYTFNVCWDLYYQVLRFIPCSVPPPYATKMVNLNQN